MRRTPVLVALGALAFVGSTTQPARADGLSIDKLPQGTLPKGPSQPGWKAPTPPDSIPATEHVDGISTRVEEYGVRKKGDKPRYRYVYVSTSDAGKSGSDDAQPASRVCFVNQFQTTESLTFYEALEAEREVEAQQLARLRQQQHVTVGQGSGSVAAAKKTGHEVRAIHLERLSVQGDQATLEATDAWLDLDTQGSRLAGSSTAKLAKVSAGPNGFALFGLREPNNGPVDFVVSAPLAPTVDPKMAGGQRSLDGIARRMQGELPGGSMLNSSCGHARFSMSIKPGLGDTATVVANAFLPPAADDDDDSTSGTEGMSKEFIEQMRAHQQRTRPVALDVSISQLESESSPLLSVTFGWAGRDQVQRF